MTIGGFKIGLCHGHQIAPAGEVEALAVLQRSLDVDLLVTGHTHRTSTAEFDGKCYVNPGSLTGAYTPLTRAGALRNTEGAAATAGVTVVNPTFMLMNIHDTKIDFFTYELPPGAKSMRITKSIFVKAKATGAGAAAAAAPVTTLHASTHAAVPSEL